MAEPPEVAFQSAVQFGPDWPPARAAEALCVTRREADLVHDFSVAEDVTHPEPQGLTQTKTH